MAMQRVKTLKTHGRFLSGGIILVSPLSCTDLFLYTITLLAVSCDAPPTLSYTTLELASRVLLSSKKPAFSVIGKLLRQCDNDKEEGKYSIEERDGGKAEMT